MRRNVIIFALTVLASAFSFKAAAEVPSKIRHATPAISRFIEESNSKSPMKSASWSVLAVRADGDTIVSYNSDVRLVPASNTKLITTGAALTALGSDYRYRTSLRYRGVVSDSLLVGDLYIVGGGDPSLGSRIDSLAPGTDSLFGSWLGMLRKAGIARVKGRVIGDGRSFDGPKVNETWQVDDLGHDYGAGFDGLSFNENVQSFKVRPAAHDGAPFSVEAYYPILPWMKYEVSGVTTSRTKWGALGYRASEFSPQGEFTGKMPLGGKERKFHASNSYGAYTCAYMFNEYLVSKGVSTAVCADVDPRGYIRTDFSRSSIDTSDLALPQEKLIEVGVWESAPLSDLVWHCNHVSDNLYAETFLRTIGREYTGSACIDSALVAESVVLSGLGLDSEGLIKVDGSGLSRKNYISADFFVSMLRAMQTTESFPSYIASLPVPGAYGTLKDRMPKAAPAVRERIHVKSGSMGGVRCYSGYVMPSSADSTDIVTFSVLTNNASDPDGVLRFCDRIMELIALEN